MHYDIAVVSETLLRASTPDGMLDPENRFSVIRCDRQSAFPSIGVCVFTSKQSHYSVAVINVAELYPELEMCGLDLIHYESRSRLFAVYRASNSNHTPRLPECLRTFSDVR
jgi:hypothetical protein